MNIPCPHCHSDLELDAETLKAMGEATAFSCPVCQGVVPLPESQPIEESVIAPCLYCGEDLKMDRANFAILRKRATFPCPLCSKMLPTSMFSFGDDRLPSKAKPPKSSSPRFQTLRQMNRNFLILGSVALLTLGGIGLFLVSRSTGDVVKTREDRVRETVNNRFFTDLIASGRADKKTLLKSWDILPYGTGYVGISGEIGTWQETEALAKKVGAIVFRLDPSEKVDTNSWWWRNQVTRGLVSLTDPGEAPARAAFLTWLPDVVADLEGETLWFSDHGEAKVIAGSTGGRVTSMDRKRRVILYWSNSTNSF
jgi:hypothetical protein